MAVDKRDVKRYSTQLLRARAVRPHTDTEISALQGVPWGKPANGFEPMAFALQKRCSTTELSRRGKRRFRARAYRSARVQSSSWVRLRQPLLASRCDM